MDLAKKMRQYRYEIKKSLNLKQGDTVESVISRASIAEVFDAEGFDSGSLRCRRLRNAS